MKGAPSNGIQMGKSKSPHMDCPEEDTLADETPVITAVKVDGIIALTDSSSKTVRSPSAIVTGTVLPTGEDVDAALIMLDLLAK